MDVLKRTAAHICAADVPGSPFVFDLGYLKPTADARTAVNVKDAEKPSAISSRAAQESG